MEAIKTRGIAKNGMLTVAVPHRFEEQELEVIVLNSISSEDVVVWENKEERFDKATLEKILEPENWKNLPMEKKLEILDYFKGSARYPGTPTDKYEVYEQ